MHRSRSRPQTGLGATTIAAIVPAAGKSARMGQPKLLMTIGGQTLIGRVADVLRAGGVEHVLVVAPPAESPEGPAVAAAARAAGAEVIIPLIRPAEMRESIELALSRLAAGRPPRWIVLTPADCPGITSHHVAALLERAALQPDRVIIPVSNKRRGHPIVMPWEVASEIAELPEGAGVNSLVAAHGGRVTEVAVSNPDLCADIDTPEDLDRWLDRESASIDSQRESLGRSSQPITRCAEAETDSTDRIKLEIRFFALARERAGRTTLEVDLPLGARVADLRAEIGQRLPALAALLPKTMIAVDEEYADDDQILAARARIAVIPPVSGGCREPEARAAHRLIANSARSVARSVAPPPPANGGQGGWSPRDQLLDRSSVRMALP